MVHHTMSPFEFLHRRLRHLHFRALPGLQRMVKGLPSFNFVHDSICRGCALGKNVKNNFPSSHTRPKGILELVHSDDFYVLFIDDFSHKAWVYFMKAKSETFCKFQEFKALAEN